MYSTTLFNQEIDWNENQLTQGYSRTGVENHWFMEFSDRTRSSIKPHVINHKGNIFAPSTLRENTFVLAVTFMGPESDPINMVSLT